MAAAKPAAKVVSKNVAKPVAKAVGKAAAKAPVVKAPKVLTAAQQANKDNYSNKH